MIYLGMGNERSLSQLTLQISVVFDIFCTKNILMYYLYNIEKPKRNSKIKYTLIIS